MFEILGKNYEILVFRFWLALLGEQSKQVF